MPQKDLGPQVCEALGEVSQSCEALRIVLERASPPDLAGHLLTIYAGLESMVELALPTPSSGELHGLPRRATTTHFSSILIRHIDSPDWDFSTWYAEKLLAAKSNARRAVIIWQNDRKLQQEDSREDLRSALDACQAYASAVTEFVEAGKLRLTEVAAP